MTRTGYTNELGWEFYTEPHHDADALWQHLKQAGEPYGLDIFGLDSMHIRRIEASILNAGSDFDHSTTPYDVGLGMFVDQEKGEFIGQTALKNAPKKTRLIGVLCAAKPHIGAAIIIDGQTVGKIMKFITCLTISLLITNTADACTEIETYPKEICQEIHKAIGTFLYLADIEWKQENRRIHSASPLTFNQSR
ncbi:MAG: aminomethyl transferase family protein [Oceanospirillaceae bacterium]|nr:aminomethyl transferase family protein [Oceanospirillaceae bacterium]